MRIGILAYGSLIANPGAEIGPQIRRVVPMPTPFKVEFARSSQSRDGAPTLVPVIKGGACVNALLLILDDSVSVEEAEDILYRRETNQIGSGKPYPRDRNPKPGRVRIERAQNLAAAAPILYTMIDANREDPTADMLADLAIESARRDAGMQGRDGITYLRDAKLAGISTPLMASYESAILRELSVGSLCEAIEQLAEMRD